MSLESNNNDFAKRIQELRKERLLSQKDLGEILGVSNKAVSKWENGESMPQMKTILKMAEVFEISPNELLSGTKLDINENNNTQADDTNEKYDNLKEENAKLKSQLSGANKKRKNTITICIVFCIICIVGILLIVISSQTNSDIKNSDVDIIENENTVISFGGYSFYPANETEYTYYSVDDINISDKKYATISETDNDDSEQKIAIKCCDGYDYIIVPSKDKDYIYVNDSARSWVEYQEQIKKEKEGSSLTTNSKMTVTDLYFVDKDNYIDFATSNQDTTNTLEDIAKEPITLEATEKGMEIFNEYYELKDQPENAKEITKLYYGNNSIIVFEKATLTPGDGIEGSDIYLMLCEIYFDDDGNCYFYCYRDGETYNMGKELLNYVY
jgi:transcriptional regulator with XRE-family HTH domain